MAFVPARGVFPIVRAFFALPSRLHQDPPCDTVMCLTPYHMTITSSRWPVSSYLASLCKGVFESARWSTFPSRKTQLETGMSFPSLGSCQPPLRPPPSPLPEGGSKWKRRWAGSCNFHLIRRAMRHFFLRFIASLFHFPFLTLST